VGEARAAVPRRPAIRGDVKPAGTFDRPPARRETPPNPFRARGPSGVCHEWCADWFDESYYAQSPGRNPRGAARDAARRRGEPGATPTRGVPSAPSSLPPHLRYSDYGVRFARDAE
jgi:formylglycine-generating enzyme required for sulfatase activity